MSGCRYISGIGQVRPLTGRRTRAKCGSFAGIFVQAGERTRTADPLFTRQALYQLSYSGVYGLVMRLCVIRGLPRCDRRGRSVTYRGSSLLRKAYPPPSSDHP